MADEALDDFIAKNQHSLTFMDKSTIVEVFSPDFIISPALSETIQKERGKRKTERSPVGELIASAEDYAEIIWDTPALAAIASLVALIGLFLKQRGYRHRCYATRPSSRPDLCIRRHNDYREPPPGSLLSPDHPDLSCRYRGDRVRDNLSPLAGLRSPTDQ